MSCSTQWCPQIRVWIAVIGCTIHVFPSTNSSFLLYKKKWLMNTYICQFYCFLSRDENGTLGLLFFNVQASQPTRASNFLSPFGLAWSSNPKWQWGLNHYGPVITFLFMSSLLNANRIFILAHIPGPGYSSQMTDSLIMVFKTSVFWFLGGVGS